MMMTGQFLFRRAFDQARQFFADDRAHRRGNETEIHHAERHAVFADLADAGQDGVFQRWSPFDAPERAWGRESYQQI